MKTFATSSGTRGLRVRISLGAIPFVLAAISPGQALPRLAVERPALFEAPPEPPPASPGRVVAPTRPGLADVHLHSGEFHRTEVDLAIPGRGLDFVWSRSYRSRLGSDTEQGNGWDYSHDLRIEAVASGVRVWDGNGRRDVYSMRPNGTYVAAELFTEGMFAPDGTFTLTFADRGTWRFAALDGSPAEGRIAAIADRNGNTLTFGYDAAGLLTSVIDTLGRRISIGHDAAGRISSITDFAGRQVQYTYYAPGEPGGAPGDLRSVRSPLVVGTPNGNDFPVGKTTLYAYSTGFADERLNHNLLTITDPLGRIWLRNTYSPSTDPTDLDFDRLVRQERGDPGDIIDVSYRDVPLTNPLVQDAAPSIEATVNDRVGNVTDFAYDARGRCLRVRAHTGRADPDQPTTATSNRPGARLRSEDPRWFETRYAYNRDSRTVRIVHPNGNITAMVYEGDLDPAAPWRERGNLRERHRLPGSHSPAGNQSQLSEYFEHETGFGGEGDDYVTMHTDARGNVTKHRYDSNGNRIQTIHRIASIVEDFAYNAHGQMVSHDLPDNGSAWRRHDQRTYHTSGPSLGYLATETVDALGASLTTSYEYDLVGNVVRVVDPRGHDLLYAVNQLNQVVRETSREVTLINGAKVRYRRDYHYDANDNLVRVEIQNVDDQGAVSANSDLATTYEYDVLNVLTATEREVDPTRSIRVEMAHDANRNPTLERRGEATNGNQPANVVAYQYDERNLLLRTIRAPGTALQSTTEYLWDGNGNQVAVRRGVEGGARTNRRVHDAFDRRVATIDAMGNVESLTYDPNGNVVARRFDGELADVVGSAGNVRLQESTAVFDAMDRPVQVDVRHFDATNQSPIGDGTARTTRTYTDLSDVLTESDDHGHVRKWTYDTAGRVSEVADPKGNTVRYAYDPNSNVVSILETELSDLGSPPQVFTTGMMHDERDRLVQSTDNQGNTTRFGYDSRDNRTRSVNARGNLVTTSFDGVNRSLATTRTLTSTGVGGGAVVGQILTSSLWDDDSRLLSRTDDNGNATRWEYDALDRLTVERCADGTERTSTWDVHDDLLATTDANGSRADHTYDLLGRRLHTDVTPGAGVSADTTFEDWAYDGLSRVVRAADDDSEVVRRHDSLGSVMAETQNGETFTATHDGEGNRLSCTYPGGRTITTTHDPLERILSTGDATGTIASYSYFGPARVQQRTAPGASLQSDWGHDAVRRIDQTTHRRAGATVDARSYAWSATYQKTLHSDVRLGGPLVAATYTQDSAERLVRTVTTAGVGPVSDIAYLLDGVGNRVDVRGAPNCSGSYVMDPTLPQPGDRQQNQYTSTPCDQRTYDRNGNLVSVQDGSELHTMGYDYRNRLVAYANGQIGTYAHDAFGRRISRTVVDGMGITRTTRYYYDSGWRVVEERDGGNAVVATYVHGNGIDEVPAMDRNGQRYHFCADDQGTIRALVEETVGVVERYDYGDYGEPSFFDGAGVPMSASVVGNPLLFTGRRYDPETGWYCYRTRYFDPRAGRFTTRDTIGTWGDSANVGNAFAYVANRPASATDPLGLAGEWLNDLSVWQFYSAMGHLLFTGVVSQGDQAGMLHAAHLINQGIVDAIGGSNPTPDDAGDEPPDWDTIQTLLMQSGHGFVHETPYHKTPLGKLLNTQGKGPQPVWNPSDVYMEAVGMGGGAGGGFSPNAGSPAEQLKTQARKGKKKSTGRDGSDDEDPPPGSGIWGDDMPGPPELVNPAWNNKKKLLAKWEL